MKKSLIKIDVSIEKELTSLGAEINIAIEKGCTHYELVNYEGKVYLDCVRNYTKEEEAKELLSTLTDEQKKALKELYKIEINTENKVK
ncbi:MAG TPA: hypothetical protein PKI46_05175 [Bacteroidales bacterium]|nr:hypothetical protein [Bacteroidales bacterium]